MARRSSELFVALGLALVLAPMLAQSAEQPLFKAVQPDLFAHPGAITSAWGDFNNDGHLDLAVSYRHGVVRLFDNDGRGKFTDVSEEVGLGQIGNAEAMQSIDVRSLAVGDYDADGYLDLYVGTVVTGRAPAGVDLNRGYLFHSVEGKKFTEVAKQLGVDVTNASMRQVSFLDFDGDGRLDLFVADRKGPKYLFHNDANGGFTDIARQIGLTDLGFTLGACWFDMDSDGRLDLFLANQDGGTDVLYHNVNGTFKDIAPSLNMNRYGRAKNEGGVGCSVGDYDNDGKLDLFLAAYGENQLYHNDGGGKFTEVGSATGIDQRKGNSVSAFWGDYDNDGLLDLFVTGFNSEREPEDRLYRNVGGRFVNVLAPGTALNVADHGVQWADFDHDGALDLSVTNNFSKTATAHTVLHNILAESRRQSSLQVMVLDQQGRSNRPGSEVRLYDNSGKLLGTRLVTISEGYDAQSVTPVHFGLPTKDLITVEVTYFTKTGRSTQRMEKVVPADWTGKVLKITQR